MLFLHCDAAHFLLVLEICGHSQLFYKTHHGLITVGVTGEKVIYIKGVIQQHMSK